MRLLILAAAVLVFLTVLWGPVLYLANRFLARGVFGLYGWLRALLPAQLVTAIVLTVAADYTERWDLGMVLAIITLAVSAIGMALISLRAWVLRR